MAEPYGIHGWYEWTVKSCDEAGEMRVEHHSKNVIFLFDWNSSQYEKAVCIQPNRREEKNERVKRKIKREKHQ